MKQFAHPLLFLLAALPARADFANGGFESHTGNFQLSSLVNVDDAMEFNDIGSLLTPAASQLGGWTYNQVLILPDGMRASEGERFAYLPSGPAFGIGQYFDVGSGVTPGQQYEVAFDVAALNLDFSGGASGHLGVAIDLYWDNDSSDGGPSQTPYFLRISDFNVAAGFGVNNGNEVDFVNWEDEEGIGWTRLSGTFTLPAPPQGMGALLVAATVVPGPASSSQEGLLLDNFTLTAVPEPSAGLLGTASGALLVLTSRKRRSAA